jgi:hypothetical protein
MAYARTTLVKRIRQVLGDLAWPDICTEAMDTTETGLDVADGTKYSTGTIVEFQDDGEQCYVVSVTGNTLTVLRNFRYSVTATEGTGTTHSINATILSTPTFLYADVVEGISSVLTGLWPYVYREVIYTLTPQTDGNDWYELDDAASNTSVALDLSSVVQIIGTGATSRVFRYGERGGAYPVGFRRDVPAAKLGSGVGLYIPYLRDVSNSIFAHTIAPILDTYAAPDYTHLTAGVEVDCVIYLVCARLVLSKDIQRTVMDDLNQGAATVQQPGSRVRLSAYFEAKGVEYRHQWEAILQRTLPRLPQGRGRV